MAKICNKCFTVYHNEKDDDCKLYKCGGKLLEIDDALMPDIILLWNKGYKTLESCSGHLTEDGCQDTMYIVFDGLSNDLTSLLKSINKNIKNADVVINFDDCTLTISIDFYNYDDWMHSLMDLHKMCFEVSPKPVKGVTINSQEFKEFYDNGGLVVFPELLGIGAQNKFDTKFDDLYKNLFYNVSTMINHQKEGE